MGLSKLGRYDIVRVLGKGAMGTVYEARDPNLERRVAIKTIAMQGLSPEAVHEYEARFRTEARSAARLQHPNVVSVYDSGRDGEIAYLVMEYVQGQDLKHHLDSGATFTLERTLRIMRDLLAALEYAHAQNVVHRDVKPANLLIEANGRVKLSDFGVARIQDAADATRTQGGMVGTLKYMSPEQVQGLPVDARSDLFAAGVVLYQLLTARQPFTGEGEFAIIAQIVGVEPPAPSTLQPALPQAIDVVLACALAKSKEQRYDSAREFHDALVLACDQVQDLSTAPMPLLPESGSGGSRGRLASSGSGASGGSRVVSTVTQELELVYWKDVRDSDDRLDLQGFLDRFPDGIYADLARRRLRRLGVIFVGEQTATVVDPRSPDSAAAASDAAWQRTDGAAPADASGPVVAPGPVTGPQSPSMRRWLIGGVTAIFVAVVAAVWLSAGDGPAQQASTVGVPQPMAAIAPAPPVPQPPGSGAAAVVALPPDVTTPTASAATEAVTRAKPRPSGTALEARTKAPASRPPAAPQEPGAALALPMSGAPSDAQASADPNPEQACTGRVLLGYQVCMNEQCAKPAYAAHPVCEQRRAAELARKQQQVNRN